MHKLMQEMRDEEARLLAELRHVPAYRRLRAVRAFLAAYAEPPPPAPVLDVPVEPEMAAEVPEAILALPAPEGPADPLEGIEDQPTPQEQAADKLDPPEPLLKRYPGRRRRADLPGLNGKPATRQLILDDVAAYLHAKGGRATSSELMQMLTEKKGHILDMSRHGAISFCAMLKASARFNNVRGRGGGYGIKDWPLALPADALPTPRTKRKPPLPDGEEPWPVVREQAVARA